MDAGLKVLRLKFEWTFLYKPFGCSQTFAVVCFIRSISVSNCAVHSALLFFSYYRYDRDGLDPYGPPTRR
jgi:hypothetical protein